MGMVEQIAESLGRGDEAKVGELTAQAIKRGRHLALLPYTAEHIRVSGVGYYR